jgi:hypothetical protein
MAIVFCETKSWMSSFVFIFRSLGFSLWNTFQRSSATPSGWNLAL